MRPKTIEKTIHSPQRSYWNALPTSAGSPAVIISAMLVDAETGDRADDDRR